MLGGFVCFACLTAHVCLLLVTVAGAAGWHIAACILYPFVAVVGMLSSKQPSASSLLEPLAVLVPSVMVMSGEQSGCSHDQEINMVEDADARVR